MPLGLIGKKIGMTRVFTEAGNSDPVTVIQILPIKVSQLKNESIDGYTAVQVAYYTESKSDISKAIVTKCKNVSIPATKSFKEFLVEGDSELESIQLGTTLTTDIFKEGQLVDVSGEIKGKGFQGTIKRHNFSGQDATHGNSVSHRVPGSIGQRQSPGKVFKGKKMSGRKPNLKCTIQNLKVIKIDAEKNLLLVKGAVPGARNSCVFVLPAVKAKNQD